MAFRTGFRYQKKWLSMQATILPVLAFWLELYQLTSEHGLESYFKKDKRMKLLSQRISRSMSIFVTFFDPKSQKKLNHICIISEGTAGNGEGVFWFQEE